MKPSITIKGKSMVGWRVYEDYEVYGGEMVADGAYSAYGVDKVRKLHFRCSRNDLGDQVSGTKIFPSRLSVGVSRVLG